MRKYGKSMFEILSEMNEATFTYDFFDANKPMSQIQADGRKYRVKLKVKILLIRVLLFQECLGLTGLPSNLINP